MRAWRNNEGKALAELALVLPFIVVTALGALEIYRNFQLHQFMSIISRELGSAAFRACTDFTGIDMTAKTNKCLEDIVELDVFPNAVPPSSPLISARIIVTVYRYNTAGTATEVGTYRHGSAQPWATSRFTTTNVTALNSYLEDKVNIVTAEVFLNVPPYLPFFSGNYYETTVF